jgi:hypothetical protein
MKVAFSRLIFWKSSNTNIRENPSSGSRVFPCGQTHRQTDIQTWPKLIVIFAILRTRLINKKRSMTKGWRTLATKPANGHDPKPVLSTCHLTAKFLKIHLNVILPLPSCWLPFQISCSLFISTPELCAQPIAVLCTSPSWQWYVSNFRTMYMHVIYTLSIAWAHVILTAFISNPCHLWTLRCMYRAFYREFKPKPTNSQDY